jgi:hypothetical protein
MKVSHNTQGMFFQGTAPEQNKGAYWKFYITGTTKNI